MELPRALASALCAADEDYLIALCNKGTVNRAKKDLAAAPPKITGAEGEAVVVAVGDAVCTITVPLGSSTCTCPSTAICRHRMSAILWLREQAARQSAPPGQAPVAPANAPPGEAAKELADLLSACPARALVRQLGERRVSALVQREAAGESADIREGGTVTVELPGTLRQLRNCRLDLAGARVSGEGNLSATTQCRGTLLQKTSPRAVLPPSAVAEDFSSLLPRSRPGLGELERLAGLLEARAHTLHKQDDRLLEVMFQAEHYIALCRERCQELEILRAWQEQQAQEAEKEEGGDLT